MWMEGLYIQESNIKYYTNEFNRIILQTIQFPLAELFVTDHFIMTIHTVGLQAQAQATHTQDVWSYSGDLFIPTGEQRLQICQLDRLVERELLQGILYGKPLALTT